MTADMKASALFYVVMLALPVAALVARRVPAVRVLGMLAGWAAIFAVGLVLIGERARFDPYLERIAGVLKLDGQQVVGKEVRIRMASDGHFWAKARIDGVERRMLIDSGATVTAVSTATASRAGLQVSAGIVPVILRTANGAVNAEQASVAELRLGDIAARDLPVVVSPAFGDMDVLGMNFLSRLKSWRVEGNTLILTPHHPQKFT